MTFNDFVQKCKLKKKAKSNITIQQVLDHIGLNNVGIFLRDELFLSDIGIVNLHPSRRSHSVCYINEKYFDSNGWACPKKPSIFNIKRYGFCLYSENQIQKRIVFVEVIVYI